MTFFVTLWLIYLMGAHMLHGAHVEVSGQHCRVVCFSPSTFTWVSGQTQATRLRQHAFSHPSCRAGPLPPSFQRQGVCPNLQLSDWVMLASQFWGVPGSAEVTVRLAVPAFLWLLGIQTQALMLGPWVLHPCCQPLLHFVLIWISYFIRKGASLCICLLNCSDIYFMS